MNAKTISQREARALQRRVDLLQDIEERRRNEWVRQYPGGIHIASVVVSDVDAAKLRIARKLEHAVVAVNGNGNELLFYALPIAEESKA